MKKANYYEKNSTGIVYTIPDTHCPNPTIHFIINWQQPQNSIYSMTPQKADTLLKSLLDKGLVMQNFKSEYKHNALDVYIPVTLTILVIEDFAKWARQNNVCFYMNAVDCELKLHIF